MTGDDRWQWTRLEMLRRRRRRRRRRRTVAWSGSCRSAAGCCPTAVRCCPTGWATRTKPSGTWACLTSRSSPSRSATRASSSSPAPSWSRRAGARCHYLRAATSAAVSALTISQNRWMLGSGSATLSSRRVAETDPIPPSIPENLPESEQAPIGFSNPISNPIGLLKPIPFHFDPIWLISSVWWIQLLLTSAESTSWRRFPYPESLIATSSRNPAILPSVSIWRLPVSLISFWFVVVVDVDVVVVVVVVVASAGAEGQCLTGEYRCADNSCIPDGWVCDGKADCDSGDDERSCSACTPQEFKCQSDNRCIPAGWACDGSPDCADGSDERQCPNPPLDVTQCQEGTFRCQDGLSCIPLRRVCDGSNHCRDNSDELNCTAAGQCPFSRSPRHLSTASPTNPLFFIYLFVFINELMNF